MRDRRDAARLGTLAALVLGGMLAAAPARGELVDKIAAIVGEDIILLSDVVKVAQIVKIRAMAAMGQDVPDEQALQMALLELIDNMLIEQAADELRVSVSESEVDAAFENQLAEQGISKAKFLEVLQAQGMDEKTYRSLILRSQLLRYKVVGLKTGGPKVTEEDAREFYNQQLMAIMIQSTFKIAHIFIRVPADADVVEVTKLKERAAKITAEARKPGADFASLAQAYSEDEATAESGGVLGKFKHGELPPEVDKVLMAMDEGSVSDPVRSPQGYHVIKMLKKKSPVVKPFEEVKIDIMNDLIQEELNRQIDILLKELRRNTYIEPK
jgi:peptidyl-prolyl cis-trans isomerase SurA